MNGTRTLMALCFWTAATMCMTAQRVMRASAHIRAVETDRGFVLTTNDAQPLLLGYREESTYEQALTNPAFRWMLEGMERRAGLIAKGVRKHKPAPFGPVYKPAGAADEVPPLCTDLWHQFSSPYFDLCPVLDGDTCVTGCVATAMAQVMRYHRWPAVGTGSHSYNDSTGCKQVLTADFSSHHYDWDYMLDDYSGSYSRREGEAVALLMSDCGIAVDTRYATDASGARTVLQAQALVNYFGYDEGLMMRYRNFYSQVEWDSIMFTELTQQRPIIVSAWTPGQGHSFVCDGYDADGLFHVSFGNPDGYGNGYYYFTFLTPDMPEWHQYKDNPEGGFNLLQAITTGVQPLVGTTPAPQHWLYAFSHLELVEATTRELTLVVHNLCNIGWNRHEGLVGIALRPETNGSAANTADSDDHILYAYEREFLLEEVDDTTYTDTLRLRLPDRLADGHWRIVPVYDDNGTLTEARTMVGIPNFLRCTVRDGQAAVSYPEESQFDLHVTAVTDFPDTLYHWTRPSYTVSLLNQGNEYSGRFFVALYTDANPQVNVIIAREGISIESGEEAVRPFSETVFRNPEPGTYHLRILADIDLFTDSLVTLYDNPDIDITVLKTPPTGIEECQEAWENGEVANYGLDGRQLTGAEIRTRRQPYISIRNGKTLKLVSGRLFF